MTTLGNLIPKNGGSHHPMLLRLMTAQRAEEREEKSEVSVPGFEIFEASMDATVLMLSLSVNRKKDEARGERMFWADKNLENELYAEVEQVAFGCEELVLSHFTEFDWVGMYQECRLNIQGPCVPLKDEDKLQLDVLKNMLNLSDEPLSFIKKAKKRSAKRGGDSDSDSDSGGDNSDTDFDKPVNGYLKWKIFCNEFTDHLVAKELRKAPISKKVWGEVEKMFENMERDRH
ncbi:hypothetical protein B0O99DRAFT_616593, partial [Bisporella sp. PMI_857]